MLVKCSVSVCNVHVARCSVIMLVSLKTPYLGVGYYKFAYARDRIIFMKVYSLPFERIEQCYLKSCLYN